MSEKSKQRKLEHARHMQFRTLQRQIEDVIERACSAAPTSESEAISHTFANDIDLVLNNTAEGGIAQLGILHERVRSYTRLLDNQRRDHEVRQNHIDHLLQRIIAEPQNTQLVVELDRTEALNQASMCSMDELTNDLRALRKDIKTLEIVTIARGSRQPSEPVEPPPPIVVPNLMSQLAQVRLADDRFYGTDSRSDASWDMCD